jgi:ketosteroid isomerase-like protein
LATAKKGNRFAATLAEVSMSRGKAAMSAMFSLTAVVALELPTSETVSNAEAETMKPIQEPITGKESLGDLDRPEQALAQFYKAFNSRDLAMIDANFAASDEVAIDNPLGGIRRGLDVPHKMYEAVFKSPADVHVEFWDYTIDRVGDVFWAVGRERGTYRDGDAVKELNIRTTRVFRLIDGRWRQVHHHGSIEDPKLLADYQNAVRSPKSGTPQPAK